MWNMATYKCKFKISRLEPETYIFRTENYIFALNSSTNTKTILRVGTKIGSVRLVETNNLFTPSLYYTMHFLLQAFLVVDVLMFLNTRL